MAYDATGLPTLMVDGSEPSKSMKKKLDKAMAQHTQKYDAQQAKGGPLVEAAAAAAAAAKLALKTLVGDGGGAVGMWGGGQGLQEGLAPALLAPPTPVLANVNSEGELRVVCGTFVRCSSLPSNQCPLATKGELRVSCGYDATAPDRTSKMLQHRIPLLLDF
jgi:hypothetical protein